MQASYAPTTAFTEAEEGGYTNDPLDSGNWSSGQTGIGTLIGSNMGCGAPATIAYMAKAQPGFLVTAAWMRALPRAVYDGMARTEYWVPLQGDRLPAGLDLACFDFGWNTGIGSAAKRLQWLIGAVQDGQIGPRTLGLVASCSLAPIARALSQASAETLQRRLGVPVDGDVGPVTLVALAAAPDAVIRPVVLLLGLGEVQTAYYRSLSNFPIYGTGWLARTGRRVAVGLQLAAGAATGAKALRLATDRTPRVPDEPTHIRWRPFARGLRIAAQAARPAPTRAA
ncbi:MAG TPA: glycosyl hydrolase 108 family protein [Rhodopila sp.]|jgi:lysozyme family protein|nr:glycosyl hydrolase 108 family protein [Rhodopila sp.]